MREGCLERRAGGYCDWVLAREVLGALRRLR